MKKEKKETKKKTANVPVVKIRMMSDEEWNALAYRNYLQRKCDI